MHFISIPQASRIPSQLETLLKRLLSIPINSARLILANHQQTTMDAFAISSPLRQLIWQDIHDLQAEIGREATIQPLKPHSQVDKHQRIVTRSQTPIGNGEGFCLLKGEVTFEDEVDLRIQKI